MVAGFRIGSASGAHLTHPADRGTGQHGPSAAQAHGGRPTGGLFAFVIAAYAVALGGVAAHASAHDAPVQRLVSAYPAHVRAIDGNAVIWHDGTRMPLDDGRGQKVFADWLQSPDIEDMLSIAYPDAGAELTVPALDHDPGRARNQVFFDKMYGSCTNGDVKKNLVEVRWLPKKSNQRLLVTRINDVDKRLARISSELDRLPKSFDKYLVPAAGTYNCRVIAGTNRLSAHGHGIAIDIATGPSDYWRWAKAGPDGRPTYRNRIPKEIVDIFEKEGFIWGGRWSHFDTMHFEYRPEMFKPVP